MNNLHNTLNAIWRLLSRIFDGAASIIGAILTAIQTATESIDDKMDDLINRVEQLEGGYAAMTGKTAGGDFVAVWASIDTISCTGFPSFHPTLLATDIEKVTRISAAGVRTELLPSDYVITVTGAAEPYVIDVANPPADFVNTDVYIIYTNVTQFVNPYQGAHTVLQAATDVGAADGVWINSAGGEVDVRNRDTITLYTDLLIQNSTGVQLRVLMRPETGGTDYLSADDDMFIYAYPTDTSQNRTLTVDVAGIAWVMVQTMATDVDDGGGTIATMAIDYILD